MSRPVIPQAKKTYLSNRITATETAEIRVNRLQDIYGDNLTMANFGDKGWMTINPGTDNAEVVSFTGFTVNADNSVSIDTGVARGLKVVSEFGAGGVASPHSPGTPVVISNVSHWYEALLDYMDAIANAGAADAGLTTAGISEEATAAEIDADEGAGSTTRRLLVNPERLAASKYGIRLPTASEKEFIGISVGAMIPYAADNEPTGWLQADGQEIDFDTYPALTALLRGKYGLPTGLETDSLDTVTDTFTKAAHGLSDNDRLLFYTYGTLPAGLLPNTVYYVISATTNTFKVSTSEGGAAVDITDTGTGAYYYTQSCFIPDMRGAVLIGQGQKQIKAEVTTDNIQIGQSVGVVTDTNAVDDWIRIDAHGLIAGDTVMYTTNFAGGTANTRYQLNSNTNTNYLHPNHAVSADSLSGATVIHGAVFTVPGGLTVELQTGDPVAVSTDGVMPNGISAGTFYLIKVTDTTFKLATTLQRALDGIEETISDVGSGVLTVSFVQPTYSIGDKGGTEKHRLTIDEMPRHEHGTYGPGYDRDRSDSGGEDSKTGDFFAGGDTPHTNMQPYVVGNWLIKT